MPVQRIPRAAKSDFLTRGQVAAIFQVSPHTVARWGKKGKLPSVLTPGGQRRYPRRAVEQLVEDLQHEAGYADDASQR